MALNPQFNKSEATAIADFKTTAQTMVSNGLSFSVQCLNIQTIADDMTVYPEASELTNWMQTFLTEKVKSKPLNPKALAEMAKKGIVPKKQIEEIILVAIIPSTTHIHVGVYVPDTIKLNPSEFMTNALTSYSHVPTTIGNYAFTNIEHSESLKERDTVLRYFFSELKKLNIYVEEEDDEPVNYLE